jgi:C4-dicarboxylate-specific signal transduction histidine kinase
MPCAVNATSAVMTNALSDRSHPHSSHDIIAEEPELAFANRAAFLGQLSASIAEINHPISAVVMNAEAALRLLLAQPTDTEAIRRLLACIVNDGMRSGDIANRTRALIKDATRRERLEGAVASLTDVDAN